MFCLQEVHNCWSTSNYTITTLNSSQLAISNFLQVDHCCICMHHQGTAYIYSIYILHRPVARGGSRGSIEPPKWSLPVPHDYCTCMACMAYSYKSWLGYIVATTALAKHWKWWLVFSDLCDLSAAVQPLCGSSIWERTPLGTSMWMHTGLEHFCAQWPSWCRQELVGRSGSMHPVACFTHSTCNS